MENTETPPSLIAYSLVDADGRVMMTGRSFAIPQLDGCTVILEEAPSLMHYRHEDTWVHIGDQPSKNHAFNWKTKEWFDKRTPESEWHAVRVERGRKLLATDWTQLPDVPIATKEAWAAYRQALRDLTLQPDPTNIVWPQPPTEK